MSEKTLNFRQIHYSRKPEKRPIKKPGVLFIPFCNGIWFDLYPLNLSCVPFFFLQIGQHDIPAHRVVLAAASPYWMELFTSEEDQPTRKEVEIDGGMLYELNGGFQKEALERLVEYSYTARLEVRSRPTYFWMCLRGHNSPIYDECQTQSAWVLTLPWERAHQDNSNDTPQPICEFQASFPSA